MYKFESFIFDNLISHGFTFLMMKISSYILNENLVVQYLHLNHIGTLYICLVELVKGVCAM